MFDGDVAGFGDFDEAGGGDGDAKVFCGLSLRIEGVRWKHIKSLLPQPKTYPYPNHTPKRP